MSAGFDQSSARGNNAGRLRDVFEHFHAGDDVEARCGRLREFFSRAVLVIHLVSTFQQVETGNAKRLFRKVYAGDRGTVFGHGFGKNSAAATDVKNGLACEIDVAINPFHAQGVDFVKRFELAVFVPPAMSQLAEFFEFLVISVEHEAIL